MLRWLYALALPSLLALPALGAAASGADGLGVVAAASEQDAAANWPQWRGPLATGAAPDADPPVTWSEGENLRFKVALAGLGHSTPVIWGQRVVLTAAVSDPATVVARRSGMPGAHDNLPVTHWYRFTVLALDRADGHRLWQQTVRRALPHEGGHSSGSLASASPITDGERVYAFFGSYGLYALDLVDGKVLWQRDLGVMHTKHGHGEGASPALYRNTLVVNWDHEGQSFLIALDARSGKQRWKTLRNEPTSWATPIITVIAGNPQVIVSGTDRVRGYSLETGAQIWQCAGLSANVVASPVAGDGMVFAASSYDTRALLAIRLEGARGDITGSDRVAWTRTQRTPYVPSPLLEQGALYFLRHYQPILSRVIAKTGEEPTGPFRLQGLRNIYASPIAAGGRIYITDREGTTLVLSAGPTPKVLATNHLDDHFSASAAVAGNEIVLRGEKSLYCLASDDGPQHASPAGPTP